jgi:S-adenosyl methyltransferase
VGTTFPVDRLPRDRLLTRTEPPGEVVIRARPAHDDVAAAGVGTPRDIWAEQMAEAARRCNRLARETQRHRSRAEVARFFDGLDMAEPGLVPVPERRPRPAAEAGGKAGHVGRCRPQAVSPGGLL